MTCGYDFAIILGHSTKPENPEVSLKEDSSTPINDRPNTTFAGRQYVQETTSQHVPDYPPPKMRSTTGLVHFDIIVEGREEKNLSVEFPERAWKWTVQHLRSALLLSVYDMPEQFCFLLNMVPIGFRQETNILVKEIVADFPENNSFTVRDLARKKALNIKRSKSQQTVRIISIQSLSS